MILLLGSRVRLRSLALTRQDIKAKGCYLNPSSQLSNLVSPMFIILRNISHKQNEAAEARQRNGPLSTISLVHFWKVRAENFLYHFILFRNSLFSVALVFYWAAPFAQVIRVSKGFLLTFSSLQNVWRGGIADYWWRLQIIQKSKMKVQLVWSEGLLSLEILVLLSLKRMAANQYKFQNMFLMWPNSFPPLLPLLLSSSSGRWARRGQGLCLPALSAEGHPGPENTAWLQGGPP